MDKKNSHSELPKIQHYVPRCLLKNFTRGNKPHIWVYDKKTNRSFQTNVKNVAAESGYYDFEHEDAVVSMEPRLAKLETSISKLLKRIEREESIGWFSFADRTLLSLFVLVQQRRTPHLREMLLDMDRQLQEGIRQMGGDINKVENYEPLDKESARLLSIKMMVNLKDQVPHILEKDWLLLKGKKANPFYISDNPIALQNMKDRGPRGNLGLKVEGIEIYLPISSTLTLAMYCPSLTDELRRGYERYKRLSMSIPWAVNAVLDEPFYFEKRIAGFEEGVAVQCIDDTILNLNYLQVRYAERQVYCEKESFWLVKDMLKENTSYKTGPRMRSGWPQHKLNIDEASTR